MSSAHRFRLGRVVATSLYLWRKLFVVLFTTTLAIHGLRVAFALASDSLVAWEALTSDRFLAYVLLTNIVDALLTVLSIAPAVYAVVARLQGRDARVGESLHAGLRRFLPVLRVGLCLGLVEATLLYGAFHVPFSWIDPLATWFAYWPLFFAFLKVLLWSPLWVAVPAAVLETPDRALRRSWRLTRGHRLAVAAIVTVPFGIDIGAGRAIALAAPDHIVHICIGWTVQLLVVSISAVFAAVGYHALRLEKEGVDVSKLEEVFG